MSSKFRQWMTQNRPYIDGGYRDEGGPYSISFERSFALSNISSSSGGNYMYQGNSGSQTRSLLLGPVSGQETLMIVNEVTVVIDEGSGTPQSNTWLTSQENALANGPSLNLLRSGVAVEDYMYCGRLGATPHARRTDQLFYISDEMIYAPTLSFTSAQTVLLKYKFNGQSRPPLILSVGDFVEFKLTAETLTSSCIMFAKAKGQRVI